MCTSFTSFENVHKDYSLWQMCHSHVSELNSYLTQDVLKHVMKFPDNEKQQHVAERKHFSDAFLEPNHLTTQQLTEQMPHQYHSAGTARWAAAVSVFIGHAY